MKPRLLLNLALVAAVIGLGLFSYWTARQDTATEYRVSTLQPPQVTEIRVQTAAAPEIALSKRPGGWVMTSPLPARADLPKVQRALELISATSKQRFPVDDPKRFDLDPPAVSVTLQGQRLSFGMRNPLTQEQYIGTAEGVYLVAPRFAAAAPSRVEDWLSRQPLAEEEIPVAFELPQFSVTQAEGKWLVKPERNDLSQDDLNRWAQGWRSAYAAAAEYAPLATRGNAIRIRLANGKEVAFEIMQGEAVLGLRRTDERMLFHFSREAGQLLLNLPAKDKQ